MFIARSSEIASRNLDGEMIIMSARDSTFVHLERGSYFHLGGRRRPDLTR